MEGSEEFESEEVDALFFTGETEAAPAQETGYLNEAYSYKQIGSIAKYVEPVSSRSSMDAVLDLFKNDSTLNAVPVEEYDHVIGIIDRKTVDKATGSAWKRFTSGNVGECTTRVDSIFHANEFIEKSINEVTRINRSTGIEYFPVFVGRSFLGLVSLDDFLTRIADIREKDLQKASVIQTAQFPTEAELAALPYKVTVWNRMANMLGGDAYLAYRISEDESIVGVFDVSGKNVAASLLTMTVSSFFKALAKLPCAPRSAVQIVSLLDAYLASVVPPGNFITSILCYMDMKKRRMHIFNCGHTTTFLFYREPGSTAPVKSASILPKLPPFGMGAIGDQLAKPGSPKEHPYLLLEMRSGIHLDLYSDGFTDMQNSDGIRFEEKNACEFFRKLYETPDEQVGNTIGEAVDKYIGGTLIPDDITVMDIRV